jgi:hypothetical protein
MTFENDKGRLSGRKPQLEVATSTDHSTAGSNRDAPPWLSTPSLCSARVASAKFIRMAVRFRRASLALTWVRYRLPNSDSGRSAMRPFLDFMSYYEFF